MIFLIPAALASFACVAYKIGLLAAKVRQRRIEGSLKDHKGYLRSYLKRAQDRSLKALRGGVSQGMANFTRGVSEIGTELSRRTSFVMTHKKSQALPVLVSDPSKLDRNSSKSSATPASKEGAPEHTASIHSSALMCVVCRAYVSHGPLHNAAQIWHEPVICML